MIRIVHYLNQFFGGIGGEDVAGVGPSIVEGPVGPGMGLQAQLGDVGTVVATVIAGDNYMAEHEDAAVAEVLALIGTQQPNVVVAGPGFGSGRYGLACGAVCDAVIRELGLPAVTGLYPESPGAEMYRAGVPILPTRETAAGMTAALPELARLAIKLGSGEELGGNAQEGLMTSGLRRNAFAAQRGSTRAIEMLLAKMSNEALPTEWPLPQYEAVQPSEPIADHTSFVLALATEAGIVPTDNPDRIPSGWASTWAKYPLADRDGFAEGEYISVHGGIDTSFANADPDRQVPLDAARVLETDGQLELNEFFYSTTGNMGSLADMSRVGTEMAKAMIADGVQAVIVGST